MLNNINLALRNLIRNFLNCINVVISYFKEMYLVFSDCVLLIYVLSFAQLDSLNLMYWYLPFTTLNNKCLIARPNSFSLFHESSFIYGAVVMNICI